MGVEVGGDKTKLVLECVDEAEIERETYGYCRAGTVRVYPCTKEEGGRSEPIFAGYKPHIYIRTAGVLGTLTDLEPAMAMPGDHVRLHVTLSVIVACEEGMRFAVREQGKTVGAGVLESIIE